MTTTDTATDDNYSHIILTTNLTFTEHSERQQQPNANEQREYLLLLGEAAATSQESAPGSSDYLELVGDSESMHNDAQSTSQSDVTGTGSAMSSDDVTSHGAGRNDDAMLSEMYLTIIGDDEVLAPGANAVPPCSSAVYQSQSTDGTSAPPCNSAVYSSQSRDSTEAHFYNEPTEQEFYTELTITSNKQSR